LHFRSWSFVDPAFAAFLAAAGCETMAGCVQAGQQFGQKVAGGNHVRVWRTPLSAAGQHETFYIKHYTYEAAPLCYWSRASRAWKEVRNYQIFKNLGIPGPEVVMAGEKRSWRGLRQALVVSREIPRCRNLASIVTDPAFRRDAALRRHILARLGHLAGVAHRRAFFHRDLKLRNILVQDFPAPDGALYWIDCPRGGFHPIPLRRAYLAAADLGDMAPLKDALQQDEWAELLAAYHAALRPRAG
jgi:hypothetical protein